ncbi:prolyl oligopeptidase family serine peptidase [Phenylobacterium sp.]|uniref:prolyl oligopeptidase family serine peptidase n=1 Tax=Phenylobacterium sp. TaxID=1871053 RepID=UPI0025F73ECE|nr:prolyl oligopeptidase family serine peptidase [Phenylobacterium sp.]
MSRLRTALFLAALAAPMTARALPPAPVFPVGATTDVIQGVTVADPYRALEHGDDPAVQAWSDAQNDRTRGYLDALPGREAVAAKLKRLITAASPSYSSLQAQGASLFALYNDPAKQQPQLVRLNAAAEPASRVAVLDPNALDPSGHTEIDWYVASPDGSKVAVSLSKNGSEDGTLHVYEVARGRELETPIAAVQYPTAGGGVAWAADGQGFWYTRYPTSGPEGERHFNQQAYFHRLGADAAKDPLALGTVDGLPRTAEIFLDNDNAAPAALASVQLGDGGQWQIFVLRQGQPALKVAAYEDRVIAAAMARDGTTFGLSRLNAPMGKVLKLKAPYTGGFAKAALFVSEQKDAAIVDGGEAGKPLVAAGGKLFVNRIAGGPSQLTAYDASGRGAILAIPPIASVADIAALPDGDVLYNVVTYQTPSYYARWSARTGASVRTGLAVTSPISFEDMEVTRAFAASKDGTKVPLNIIARKGLKLDGSHPTLLYGYGGYGINQTPHFLGAMSRLWLDGGGVYVEANIRGGGEYGERWHADGMLTKKQNVFDDFAAAGDWLVANHYTTHDKLALRGGSNGGLLMGAEITQHPGLARAVVSAVGIYDMMRVELDPNGAFNVTEFGTVKDPAQFKALYAYSPLHHVTEGVTYPSILFLTGANDGRVNPLNSRKFAAELQAATGSDRPILLRTSKTSGHGIGSSLDDRIAEQTDQLVFLFDQLGMSAEAAGR